MQHIIDAHNADAAAVVRCNEDGAGSFAGLLTDGPAGVSARAAVCAAWNDDDDDDFDGQPGVELDDDALLGLDDDVDDEDDEFFDDEDDEDFDDDDEDTDDVFDDDEDL